MAAVDFKSRRILKHYHPGYNSWPSTYRYNPLELPNVLADHQAPQNNVFLQILGCGSKLNFEPLFCSLTVYSSSSAQQLTRLSETFYFDATPDTVRKKYPKQYSDDKTLSNEVLASLLSLPSDLTYLKSQSITFVFQVYKVLTSDAESMVAPYTRGVSPRINATIEATGRISRFHAPIALGLWKYTDEAESAARKVGGIVVRPIPLKGAVGAAGILGYINMIGAMPEATDIEIRFTLKSVGRERQVDGTTHPLCPRWR